MPRSWEKLPDLPSNRVNHGCGLVEMNKSKYLIVFGGRTSSGILDNSILFLNLKSLVSGWQPDARMKLNVAQQYITGNLIKHLSPIECDLMYITKSELHICKGNFTWTITPVPARSSTKKSVPVGTNALWPCANGAL
jgi:hypothetical protein